MEDQEPLKTCALIGQFSDAIQDQINDFFANRVMASGIIVCSVFLASDQLLRVEQLTVGSSADLKKVILEFQLG